MIELQGDIDKSTIIFGEYNTGQEATVRTGHETKDWFQIAKGVCQGCIMSPCLVFICRVHHEKHWAVRSTSWNQDGWEKYQ